MIRSTIYNMSNDEMIVIRTTELDAQYALMNYLLEINRNDVSIGQVRQCVFMAISEDLELLAM